MKWTPERSAAVVYAMTALAAGSIWAVLIFAARPAHLSAGDMVRSVMSEPSARALFWSLAFLPPLCLAFAVAYLTPFARKERVALALWIAGAALAVAAWFSLLVPIAVCLTLASAVITAYTSIPIRQTRTPKCSRCAADIPRGQIAGAVFPHWLACRSCNAPLIGDRFVKRAATLLGTFLVLWVVSFPMTMYFVAPEMAAWVLFVGAVLYLVLWPTVILLTCRYGNYMEREPTASRWWNHDVGQWVRPYGYESARLYNGVMVVGCTVLLLGFFMGSLWIVSLWPDEEWVRTAHSPYVYAAFGFGMYFLLVGHPWTRVLLVAAVPFAVRVIIILMGHVPADDLPTALVFGAYDITVFVIGAAGASALVWLRTRRRMDPAV